VSHGFLVIFRWRASLSNGGDTRVASRAQASKAAIPSAADASAVASAATASASGRAKSPRRSTRGGGAASSAAAAAAAAAAATTTATTAFERKRAFGGIYSHSAEDADEAKFVTDSFAVYASTNALYPVC
jgi:hypothetical protein